MHNKKEAPIRDWASLKDQKIPKQRSLKHKEKQSTQKQQR